MRLSHTGLPIFLNEADSKLTFEDGLIFEETSSKSTVKIQHVLYNPAAASQDIAFDFYKNVHFPEDGALFTRHGLRFDLTVVHPGLVGGERKKTTGHIHAKLPGSQSPHAELYEVYHGTAMYLLQPDEGGDVPRRLIAVTLRAGEKIIVPANYAHCTVNVGEGTLVFGNLVLDCGSNEYGAVASHGGMAVYVLEREGKLALVRNPAYPAGMPMLYTGTVAPSVPLGTEAGQPMYRSFLSTPEDFAYLRDPEPYQKQIEALLSTEPLVI